MQVCWASLNALCPACEPGLGLHRGWPTECHPFSRCSSSKLMSFVKVEEKRSNLSSLKPASRSPPASKSERDERRAAAAGELLAGVCMSADAVSSANAQVTHASHRTRAIMPKSSVRVDFLILGGDIAYLLRAASPGPFERLPEAGTNVQAVAIR